MYISVYWGQNYIYLIKYSHRETATADRFRGCCHLLSAAYTGADLGMIFVCCRIQIKLAKTIIEK